MASNDSQWLSIFDLDALREAFLKSVRENNVTEEEWGEHAQRFIQHLADQDLSGEIISQTTGAEGDQSGGA